MSTWKSAYLLQNPKSRLTNVDFSKMFADPRAWQCLTLEEKEVLVDGLPEHVNLDRDAEGQPVIPQNFLRYDLDWRNGHRCFQEDLAAGHLDPKWLRKAGVAMEARARGDFDQFKIDQYESFWGQKQKLASNVIAGSSSKMKLEELVRAGKFAPGDIWSFERKFGGKAKGKGSSMGPCITVEKEAKVIGFSARADLTFSFPPGQHKFSSQQSGEDIIVTNITGPQALHNAILREDGRIEDPPNGNAWKIFRVSRNNQDLGSIWDIRQAHWLDEQEAKQQVAQRVKQQETMKQREDSSPTTNGKGKGKGQGVDQEKIKEKRQGKGNKRRRST